MVSRDQSPSTTARTEKEPLAHTPGPWFAHDRPTPGKQAGVTAVAPYRSSQGAKRRIAWVGSPRSYSNPPLEAQDYADARLIAASPDLLEACIAWRRRLAPHTPGTAEALAQIDAAIAKAVGTSEPAGSGEAVATGQTPGGDQ